MTSKNDAQFYLRLPSALLTKIKEQADKEDRSANYAIVHALREAFDYEPPASGETPHISLVRKGRKKSPATEEEAG